MPRPKSNKPKPGLLDGYRTYDPQAEGYGNPAGWRESFHTRMGMDEAKATLGNDDPLTMFGLKMGATWQQIKSAFRKLACKWHPDLNPAPEATKMMQKINAAYVILEARYGSGN